MCAPGVILRHVLTCRKSMLKYLGTYVEKHHLFQIRVVFKVTLKGVYVSFNLILYIVFGNMNHKYFFQTSKC